MEQLPNRSLVLQTLFEQWNPQPKTELVPLKKALNRILAETLYSSNTLPVCRASMFDGVAVKAERFQDGRPDTAGWRLGEDFVRADTGDDFDDRFDAVIRIEEVRLTPEGGITIVDTAEVKPGSGVRSAGSTLKAGEELVRAGTRILPMDLAVLAAGGADMVPVVQKPRVAFLPTGSELVAAGMAPQRGQNIDSNSVMIEPMLEELGAEPVMFPITRDEPEALEKALDAALEAADIVMINGGSSKGDEDWNARLLEKKGKVLFHWIAAVPGKPMCVALIGDKAVVNVPGPAMAAFHAMQWCVNALVSHWLGVATPLLETVPAVLTDPLTGFPGLACLCRITVKGQPDGTYTATPVPFKQVSFAQSMGTNAIYITDESGRVLEKGEVIQAMLLRNRATVWEDRGERV